MGHFPGVFVHTRFSPWIRVAFVKYAMMNHPPNGASGIFSSLFFGDEVVILRPINKWDLNITPSSFNLPSSCQWNTWYRRHPTSRNSMVFYPQPYNLWSPPASLEISILVSIEMIGISKDIWALMFLIQPLDWWTALTSLLSPTGIKRRFWIHDDRST